MSELLLLLQSRILVVIGIFRIFQTSLYTSLLLGGVFKNHGSIESVPNRSIELTKRFEVPPNH